MKLIKSRRCNRGATLVEYSFALATVMITSMLGILYFQQSAEAYYQQTTNASPFSHDEKPLLSVIVNNEMK
jgi:hypothetical protein